MIVILAVVTLIVSIKLARTVHSATLGGKQESATHQVVDYRQKTTHRSILHMCNIDSIKVARLSLNFTIASAEIRDSDAIVALVNSAYRGDTSRIGWTTEADLLGGQRIDRAGIQEILADSQSVILLARVAEQISACVHLEKKGDAVCYLGLLTVRPDLQAGGIGRELLAAAERHAQVHWYARVVEMTVIDVRAELIAWYERRGYRSTGETRPFPYGDSRFGLPRSDGLRFIVMRKQLAFPAA